MRGFYKSILSVVMVLLVAATTNAQISVKGKITDALNGDALIGANILVKGTTNGTATDAMGRYSLSNVDKNSTLIVTSVGYASTEVEVGGRSIVDVELNAGTTELTEIEILSSRATKETPFSFSTVDKKAIQASLGSRDIPLALNATPSVYATNQGGGAGDSRINVRGFNQRNIVVMINGVPVNDMENGWVYWSNWDGLGDASSSIQIQRGLSAVNLATPSIGGTMNIITDPAKQDAGVYLKSEYGSWNFRKTTMTVNSGLLNDKWAFNGTLVRKTGDGFSHGNYTDAWAYYFGTSYQASAKDRFEFYVIGAPQRHGQNLYRQNIGRYSHDLAKTMDGYDVEALDRYNEKGWDFNQNFTKQGAGYEGQIYEGMYSERTRERFTNNYMMERENFFHKPQVNFNWYHNFSDKLNWATTAYWSGGRGGGSGTYGSVSANYGDAGQRMWDAEIAQNSNNIDSAFSTSLNRSTGVMRNSRNNQYTIGAISKLYYKVNDNLNLTLGVDWRTAEIEHYREVRDLLGGDYYVDTRNAFDLTPESQMKRLGDKVNYNNTNTVDWLGTFASAKYKKDAFSAFLMGGYTTVSYGYTDFFSNDGNGNYVTAENNGLAGGQVKAGLLYQITENFSAYANGGYVSKNPIFDFAIDDGSGEVFDPINENFLSFEGGIDLNLLDGKSNFKLNYYNTTWNNRTRTVNIVNNQTNEENIAFLQGINANHSGIEAEFAIQPVKAVRLDVGASFGNWVHTSDAVGSFQRPGGGGDTTVTVYLDGLMVGDAPQNQIMGAITLRPFDGFRAIAEYRYYAKHFSNYSPEDRTLDQAPDADQRIQTWQVPNYGVVDLHLSYNLPIKASSYQIEAFAHVFNVMNKMYIQDAFDNSPYNAFDRDHDADDAEVFLGLPRNYNIGFVVRF